MDVNCWIVISNFLVAIGTISLASIAWITIRHATKESRNKKLDEIIEWATKISESDLSLPELLPVETKENWELKWKQYIGYSIELKHFERQGILMYGIALTFKQKILRKSIDLLLKTLIEHKRLAQELIKNLDFGATNIPDAYLNAEAHFMLHMTRLRRFSTKVVNDAARIKITS